jgi:hypothetical protein
MMRCEDAVKVKGKRLSGNDCLRHDLNCHFSVMFCYRNPSIFVSEIHRFSNVKAFTYRYCEVKIILEQVMKVKKGNTGIAPLFL